MADHSIDADALSTCVFIMGADRGMDFLAKAQKGNGICIDMTVCIYIF